MTLNANQPPATEGKPLESEPAPIEPAPSAEPVEPTPVEPTEPVEPAPVPVTPSTPPNPAPAAVEPVIEQSAPTVVTEPATPDPAPPPVTPAEDNKPSATEAALEAKLRETLLKAHTVPEELHALLPKGAMELEAYLNSADYKSLTAKFAPATPVAPTVVAPDPVTRESEDSGEGALLRVGLALTGGS